MPQFYTEEEATQAIDNLISKKLFQNARIVLDENIQIFPDSAKLRFQSSQIALETSDFASAIKILEELNQVDPNRSQILLSLARAWNMFGDIERALCYLEEASQSDIHPKILEQNRAEFYERSGQLDLLDECISKLPNEARMLNIRARALIARKDFSAAVDLLNIKFETGLLEINELIANQFILAKAYDKLGDYDKAWCAAQKAHELDQTPFYEGAYFAGYDNMIDFMNADLVDSLADGPTAEMEPLFIVGNPRSGTSLLEQILSMHPDIANAGELSVGHTMQMSVARLTDSFHAWPTNMIDMRKEDAAELSKQYVAANVDFAQGKKVVSNKALNLPTQLGFLSKVLPSSRAVMLHRHPLDNAVSCYTTNLLISGHSYANSLETLGKTWIARKKITDHWLEVLSIPMMELHYEDLVADQRKQTERLIEFLDLPWQEDCMEFHKSKRVARTISYDQVNKKMYKTSSGRWKNYEKHLGPLIDIVSDYI